MKAPRVKGKGAVLESTSSSVGRPDGITMLNGLDPMARVLAGVRLKGDVEIGELCGLGSGVKFQVDSGVRRLFATIACIPWLSYMLHTRAPVLLCPTTSDT